MRRVKFILALQLTILVASGFTACTDYDDNPADSQSYAGVPLIILDTDIGSSTDDLFAMQMLHRYHDEGRCRLLGTVVNREGEDCAACADVMNTYFHHGDLPIGLIRNGIKTPKVWIDYQNLPNHTLADGSPMFARTLSDYASLPDGWQLYRRLLAAQPNHSVSIVSIGFVCCLAQLLESEADELSPLDGPELVRQKVKCLYIMGGVFGDAVEKKEYNFLQGIGFAQTLFRLWPSEVDIIFTPGEAGDGIAYTPEQVIADVDWTDNHPIKQVYMNYECDTGQKMWDLLAVINAVEGDSLFTLSERGTVSVTDDAETVFTASPTGNCRYQKPGDATWNAAMLERVRSVNRLYSRPDY
ncbi:MAG: nucleoside hydrolase [Prevotella sp.]|nr:nucleoside hydrolase [Prevotella sp.]